MSNFEIAQRARNRLSSCADEFSNLFVRQRQFYSGPLFRLLYSGGPRQEKPGEFFLGGGRQTHRSQLFAGSLILHGHLPGHALGCFGMLGHKALEVFPANEGNLARTNRFRGHFIRAS